MTENPILARDEFLGSNIERPVPKSPIKKPMTYIRNIAIMEEKIANLKFSEGFIILDLYANNIENNTRIVNKTACNTIPSY